MEYIKYLANGDTALSVEFGDEIKPEISEKIRALKIALEKSQNKAIKETVPTYRSLMIHYRPEIMSYDSFVEFLQHTVDNLDSIEIPKPSVIEIPVFYGGEHGPDIEFVAKHNGKTVEEVIDIHTSKEYLIYMIGFLAGFPYLGGMDKEIAAPRLDTPRVKITAGSVGIAGEQTGIYPIDSPGGWQLIGKTPLRLYDHGREEPILLSSGQYIKFKSVSFEEYNQINQMVNDGSYEYKIYDKGELI